MNEAVNKEVVELRFKEHEKQLDDHDKRISYLERTTSILEKMDYRMGNVEKTVDNINLKLDTKNEEKKKDVKGLITFILQAILTIIIGYIAVKLGLK